MPLVHIFSTSGHAVKHVDAADIVSVVTRACASGLGGVSVLAYRERGGCIRTTYGCSPIDTSLTTQQCGDLAVVDCTVVMLVCSSSARDMQLRMKQMYTIMKLHIASQTHTFVYDLPSLEECRQANLGYSGFVDVAEDELMRSVHTWNWSQVACTIDAAACLSSEMCAHEVDPYRRSYEDEHGRFTEYVVSKLLGGRTLRTVAAVPMVRYVTRLFYMHQIVPFACAHSVYPTHRLAS